MWVERVAVDVFDVRLGHILQFDDGPQHVPAVRFGAEQHRQWWPLQPLVPPVKPERLELAPAGVLAPTAARPVLPWAARRAGAGTEDVLETGPVSADRPNFGGRRPR